MNGIDLLFWAASLSLISLFWYWCMYQAYPLFLDKQVRRGKSWLYIPKCWNNSKRTLYKLYTKLMIMLLAVSFAFSIDRILHSGDWGLPSYVSSLIVVLPLYLGAIYLYRTWIKVRYLQQEKFYFDKLNTQLDLYESQGRDISEVEVRNRVRWEHQNALRRADEANELLKVLKLNTKIKH